MPTIIKAGNKNHRSLHFSWFFVNWCNYNCSYCYAHDQMVERFDKETSPSKHRVVLQRLGMMNIPFTIELVGGEPTLHPHIVEVVSLLSGMEHCKNIELVTNLSRPLLFFEKFNKPNDKLSIVASYHPEYHNEEFIAKAKVMSEWGIDFSVDVSIPDDPSLWNQVEQVIEELEGDGVECCFTFLYANSHWTPNYPDGVYDRFLARFKDQVDVEYEFDDGTVRRIREEEILEKGYNRFNGYKCTPMMYTIDTNGDITNTCTGRTLPLMITEQNSKVEETCPVEQCTCDVMFNYCKRQP